MQLLMLRCLSSPCTLAAVPDIVRQVASACGSPGRSTSPSKGLGGEGEGVGGVKGWERIEYRGERGEGEGLLGVKRWEEFECGGEVGGGWGQGGGRRGSEAQVWGEGEALGSGGKQVGGRGGGRTGGWRGESWMQRKGLG